MKTLVVRRQVISALYAIALGTVVLAAAVPAIWAEATVKAPHSSRISLISDPVDQNFGTIEVRGLTNEALERLATQTDSASNFSWASIFSVYTGDQAPTDGRPAVLGRYSVEADRVRFIPRYPFLEGQPYFARWQDPWQQIAPIETRFSLRTSSDPPTAIVEAIYPSGDRLPENLLKFYLHFSAPMSRDEAIDHLHLLRDDGSEVSFPFIALRHELWNGNTDRLTVFFDPGRIKRGVGPNEALGLPLQAGRRYQLVVDAAWRDARGQPLREGFEKSFRVVEADREQPAVSTWRLSSPDHPKAPLVLDFPEALDRALLERLIQVIDSRKEPVAGKAEISERERRWTFQPRVPWHPGRYAIRIDTALEDLAGNSLRRLFETELTEPENSGSSHLLEFTVAAR